MTPNEREHDMAHDPKWHAEYARLEMALAMATSTWREASRKLSRKRVPTGARADYDAALAEMRAASRARYDFEMAGTRIVDIATLPAAEWARALVARQY